MLSSKKVKCADVLIIVVEVESFTTLNAQGQTLTKIAISLNSKFFAMVHFM